MGVHNVCVPYLQRFVEQTGSSPTIQKVMVLLHIAVGEPLGQVETVNVKVFSDNRSRKNTFPIYIDC